MLSAMPRDMQQEAARHLRHTLDHGLPPSAQAILGEQAEGTARMLSGMQAKLRAQEKEQHARIAIHHYHCDHLGTPMALTDQTGQVAWAAKLDPWGNMLQEYNPQGIHQAIRLPGQHHDRETGLYYNRHPHYDPVVGSYVNQDPIGLAGGVNTFRYPGNPISWTAPLGLDSTQLPKLDWPACAHPPGGSRCHRLNSLHRTFGSAWHVESSLPPLSAAWGRPWCGIRSAPSW
jgi:RHS repeat-associated protein